MAKEYTWFKFKIPDWMMGRIQKQKPEVRGVFLNLACKYWQKHCKLSIEDAKESVDEVDYAYDNLLAKGIVSEKDGFVIVAFLDEQWAENQLLSEKKSLGGKASASKRVVKDSVTEPEQISTDVEDVLTDVEFCSTIKNKIRENENENKSKNENINYVRDEAFEKSVLRFFGFNEITHPEKQSLVFQFCSSLNNSNKLEPFKPQFEFYCKYKTITGFKHNFNKFLGTQSECFDDGAWNKENWEFKYKEVAPTHTGAKKKVINHANIPGN